MSDKLFAYHLDFKRGLWSLPYLETLIQRLAELGYNAILLEIEDKLQFRCAPEVAAPDALSHDEMASLVTFCRKQGLEVIPLVQSLGHAEYVVGKPAYAHLRESPEVDTQYDPLSPEARELIVHLFDEAIEAINPQTWFHIGGDETWSLGSSEKSRPVVAKHGVGGLYLQHIIPLCEHILKRGLRPMIWADMFLSYPELLGRVPNGAMLVDWDYWTTSWQPENIIIWGGYRKEHHNAMADASQYPEALQKPGFRKHLHPYAQDNQGRFKPFYCTDALLGHGVNNLLLAPANSCGGDLVGIPRNHAHIPNCWHATRKGMKDAHGALVTSWSVRHVHPEARLLGTFAAAQAARDHDSDYDFDDICLSFSKWMYGTALEDFPEAVRLSSQSTEMCQAYRLVQAREALLQGNDAYRILLDEQISAADGKEAFIEQLTALRADHLKAGALLREIAPQAHRNQAHFEYWLEGVELSVLHTDFILAMCHDALPQQGPALAQRMAALRRHSESLFAPTFTGQGLAQEMEVRYGFHELYLETLGIAAGVMSA